MDPRVCHKTTVTVVSLTQTTLSINGIPIFSFVGQSQLPTKYTGSDVPDQDVDDNENAVPPAPTAPPPDMFGTFAGYENANFGESKGIEVSAWLSGCMLDQKLSCFFFPKTIK